MKGLVLFEEDSQQTQYPYQKGALLEEYLQTSLQVALLASELLYWLASYSSSREVANDDEGIPEKAVEWKVGPPLKGRMELNPTLRPVRAMAVQPPWMEPKKKHICWLIGQNRKAAMP